MATILLIEDDSMMSETIRTMLASAEHAVVAAQNGQEGIDLVRTRAFDLIITDILMPEKEGIETIIALRASHPSLPIIAISGGGRARMGHDLLTMAKQFGARRTLLKPFTRKELFAAVAACLTPEADDPAGPSKSP